MARLPEARFGQHYSGTSAPGQKTKLSHYAICESTGDLFEKRFLRCKIPACPTTGKDEAYLAAKITCKKDGYVFYKPAKEIKMPGPNTRCPRKRRCVSWGLNARNAARMT